MMTMWQNFLAAFALLLVFEGVLPFLSPDNWRQMLGKMMNLDNRTLRIVGFVSMMLGTAILTYMHWHLF
ncbi:MAG: DUF2065 domain-containing protein [Gammaproteobacteria bacterium]